MSKSLLRTDKEIADLYTRHSNMLYRVCYSYMKNASDTENAVQDTFIRLIEKGPRFESEEHEKAWLIRTATNICKNTLKHWWRKNSNIDDLQDVEGPDNTDKIGADEVLRAVMDLPDKYKTVVYLYYYEGYTSVKIADMLNKPQSTIRNYLHEARLILRERLDDLDEEY